MKKLAFTILIASLLFGLISAARADEIAVTAGYTARISPGVSARNIAMLHIAMFEALNSIEPRYTSYRTRLSAEPGTSRDAAAATAAHYILVHAYSE
jgi:hypothetical protein